MGRRWEVEEDEGSVAWDVGCRALGWCIISPTAAAPHSSSSKWRSAVAGVSTRRGVVVVDGGGLRRPRSGVKGLVVGIVDEKKFANEVRLDTGLSRPRDGKCL